MRVNYEIIFVSDMSESVAFYRDVLGIPLKFESPHWSEFATEGATLALHVAKADSDDEAPGRCRPGIAVPDLDEFHQRMVAANVTCLQEPRDVFGARVALYRDPDGLPFSVGEERGGR